MFTQVNGEFTDSCYVEIAHDDELEPCGVNCMRHGVICWTKTNFEILFEFVGQKLEV